MLYKRKRVLALLTTLLFVFSFTLPAMGASTADIDGHWANPQITSWLDQGLVAGYPDGSFKPDNQVTRAEFITMVNKAFNFEETAEFTFTDVQDSDWFATQIAKAVAADYISGYEDGTMRPNKEISRQEAAAIMAKIKQLKTDIPVNVIKQFTDFTTIADWSKGAVEAVVAVGYMSGYPDQSFKATNPITRAEAVVLLDNVLNPSQPAAFTGLKGVVTQDEEVVEEALVRVFGPESHEVLAESLTDAQGAYTIVLEEAGTYDLTVTKDDYVAYAAEVQVSSDEATIKDLALEPGTVLKGVLKDKNGNKISKAKLFFTTNPTFITTTDSNGNYSVTVLPDRTYSVRGYQDNDQDKELEVFVSDLKVGNTATQKLVDIRTNYTVRTGGGGSGGGGGGGGGGSSSTSKITVSKMEVTTNNGNYEVTDNITKVTDNITKSFAEVADTTKITGLKLTTNVSQPDLVIDSIQVRGQEWLEKELKETLASDGSLTLSALLGTSFDPDQDGVSLLNLRTVLGTGDIIVRGYLTKEGYKDSDKVTVTVNLGQMKGSSPQVINQPWGTIEKTGARTAKVTIDSSKSVQITDVEAFADLVTAVATKGTEIKGGQTTDANLLKNAIKSLVASDGTLDLSKLQNMTDKTVTFDEGNYKVIFKIEK